MPTPFLERAPVVAVFFVGVCIAYATVVLGACALIDPPAIVTNPLEQVRVAPSDSSSDLETQLVQALKEKATATARVAIIEDEQAAQEAKHVRTLCYTAGFLALLIAGVAAFLAIRLPVFSKTFWSLTGAGGIFAALAFTTAAYWQYMLIGGAVLVIAAVVIGLIVVLKHANAITVLQGWVTTLETDWDLDIHPKVAASAATIKAAAAGVTALVTKA